MFRSEALIRDADRLNGHVVIVVPITWQSIGFLIFGGVALGVLFLSLASYSRVETVTVLSPPILALRILSPPVRA
jgi:membrane fusion protein